jgi:hypothetical protein
LTIHPQPSSHCHNPLFLIFIPHPADKGHKGMPVSVSIFALSVNHLS